MKKNNQYVMYGTLVSDYWYQSFISKGGIVVDDKFVGCITPIFDGRDGKFVIIGEILIKTKSENIITIPEINDERQQYVKNKVKELYGFDGEFNYYYIKNN